MEEELIELGEVFRENCQCQGQCWIESQARRSSYSHNYGEYYTLEDLYAIGWYPEVLTLALRV